MTEAQWLASTDPQAMLERLRAPLMMYFGEESFHHLVSERKLRLFACAMYAASTLPAVTGRPESYQYVERVEDFPDWNVDDLLRPWMNDDGDPPAAVKAALLRDIFGNPWRPVQLPWICADGEAYPKCPNGNLLTSEHLVSDDGNRCLACGAWRGGSWLTWNDGTVPKIAEAIYDGRRFEEMPILADALEEAGCDNEEILRHCRGEERCACELPIERPRHPNGLNLSCNQCRDGWRPLRGPHVRGCWVLDLLTGKE